MKLIATMLIGLLLPHNASAGDLVEGPARVVDGDTIEIDDQRIRLWGIDAPEVSQFCAEDGARYPCGLDVSQALRKRIGSQQVSCARRDTDRYGRMVGLCTIEGGIDISRWMVQQGQAIAFRKYSLDYVEEEYRAKVAKVGIWAGEFQDPSDYRHRVRPATPRTARRNCACSEDMDRAGRRCGERSADRRMGGAKPACGSQ